MLAARLRLLGALEEAGMDGRQAEDLAETAVRVAAWGVEHPTIEGLYRRACSLIVRAGRTLGDEEA